MLGIGQAGRHIEREAAARAREKFRRRERRHYLHQANSLTALASAIAKNSPPEATPNIGLAVDHALLAELDQIVEQRARHLGPQLAADMQIGLEAAARRRRKAQGVAGTGLDPVVDIGAEGEHLAASIARNLKLDGEERHVFDD